MPLHYTTEWYYQLSTTVNASLHHSVVYSQNYPSKLVSLVPNYVLKTLYKSESEQTRFAMNNKKKAP